MAVHVKIKTPDDNYVHFDTWQNNYTLCGLETGGDNLLGLTKGEIINSKVNCPHCIKILKFCLDINKNEWINNQ